MNDRDNPRRKLFPHHFHLYIAFLFDVKKKNDEYFVIICSS